MEINLQVKISAYTKVSLNDFVQHAPIDGKLYVQKDGIWYELPNSNAGIILPTGSGLSATNLETGEVELAIKQFVGFTKPDTIEEDVTYYIIEGSADLYIVGGSPYSDGSNDFVDESEYGDTIVGGTASTSTYELVLIPLNSEGVYNG